MVRMYLYHYQRRRAAEDHCAVTVYNSSCTLGHLRTEATSRATVEYETFVYAAIEALLPVNDLANTWAYAQPSNNLPVHNINYVAAAAIYSP